MYLNDFGYYLPEQVIPNSYFLDVNGLTSDWIVVRTGIHTRRKAASHENANTMAIKAVENLVNHASEALQGVDLIIGAGYTPYDSVATIAHVVQRHFEIHDAMAVYLSTACSSFINALELAEGYFALNKAKKALIINSEHNTAYSHEGDDKSGHLWGDAATAVTVCQEPQGGGELQVIDIKTRGLACEGKGSEAVWLRLKSEGLLMPFGKDVFMNACNFMRSAAEEILSKNDISIEELNYLIPHQANIRIINHVAEKLGLIPEKVIINVDRLGNTGSASTVIGLIENKEKFQPGDNIVLSVFGGGYSVGATLLRKQVY